MEESNKINEVEIRESVKEVDINLLEVCKSICKILLPGGAATGFFIKLYKDEKELLGLMTNEHVIKKEMIESNEIVDIYYNCEKNWSKIKLDKTKRYIAYNKNLDIIFIEIKSENKIKEKYFLLPNMNNIDYINKDIYIVQYPEGKNLSHSDGKIKDIKDINFELVYLPVLKKVHQVAQYF